MDELKSGYSRDSDYRQKTHALSQDRQSLESEKQSLRQNYDTRLKELNNLIGDANTYISQTPGEKDLQKMYEEDPTAAAKLDFQMRQQRESFNKLK